ncbi:transposase [Trichonephila clavipes]|nr:transposase [Trichonephila clavipes]
MDRISICEALTKRNEIDPFLKWMAIGDEKWVTYYNIVRKRLWSKCGEAAETVAKPGLSAKKKRPELASRRGVAFHQDNTRLHMSVVTRQKLWEFDWKGFMHPPHSPNLAPNDYHLFLALQNFQSDLNLG